MKASNASMSMVVPAPSLGPSLRLPAALVILVLLGTFALVHGGRALLPVFGNVSSTAALFLIYIAAVPVHEWLHLVGYRVWGRVPRNAVRVIWHPLASLAQCDAPMSVRAYRAAIALPGLVLGVGPAVAGLLTGNTWLAAIGAFNTGAAMADARVLWALRSVASTNSVELRMDVAGYCVKAPPAER